VSAVGVLVLIPAETNEHFVGRHRVLPINLHQLIKLVLGHDHILARMETSLSLLALFICVTTLPRDHLLLVSQKLLFKFWIEFVQAIQ